MAENLYEGLSKSVFLGTSRDKSVRDVVRSPERRPMEGRLDHTFRHIQRLFDPLVRTNEWG